MIKRLLPAFCLSLVLAFSSCIADEPLNSECDILGVDSTWLAENSGVLIGNPFVRNRTVIFYVKKGTDRSSFAPKFNLTPGAGIFYKKDGVEMEANGVELDFNQTQTYTVKAEDGVWSKEYTVSFSYLNPPRDIDFEHTDLEEGKQRFDVWYALDKVNNEDCRIDYWATGNPGYALCGLPKQASDYPTAVDEDGRSGKCVKLVTRTTGNFGMQTRPKMPIAAGSLFVGDFKTQKATTKPREATTFGLQLVESKPLSLEGYYKFTAGEVFTDHLGREVEGKVDTCDIYAVLYEVNPAKFVPLDGNNILSSDRIVSMARIDDPGYPTEWKKFEEEFKPRNGKTYSQEKADRGEYALTVVFTSSREGAYFKGAVGSTLYVDEVRINWDGE